MDGEQSDSIESGSFRRKVSQCLMASVRPSTKDRQDPRPLLALTAEARVVKTGQRNGHTPSIPFRHFPPNSAKFGYATEGAPHTSSTAFRHLPPNSARFGYATEGALHTPSTTFRHLPPKEGCRKPVLGVWGHSTLRASLSGTFLQTARFSYATEGALFITAQLSTDAVSALRKVRVLI